MTDKIGVILLNSIPNSWYKQTYVKGFDCESITFKKYLNMFERMEIFESIYEGVVELSYKKITREDANRAGRSSQKRGEAVFSCTRPEKGESAGKRRKRHVDITTGK